MTAAKLLLEPIWEADFLPSSFGYRPGRSVHDALETVRVEANRGADWVLETDVSNAFGNLDHKALMARVAKRVCDRQMLTGWSHRVGDPPGLAHLPPALQHRPAPL